MCIFFFVRGLCLDFTEHSCMISVLHMASYPNGSIREIERFACSLWLICWNLVDLVVLGLSRLCTVFYFENVPDSLCYYCVWLLAWLKLHYTAWCSICQKQTKHMFEVQQSWQLLLGHFRQFCTLCSGITYLVKNVFWWPCRSWNITQLCPVESSVLTVLNCLRKWSCLLIL